MSFPSTTGHPDDDRKSGARGRPDDLLVLGIRVAVVLSLLVLVFLLDDTERAGFRAIGPLIGVAAAYAGVLLVARLIGLPAPPTWLVSGTDSVLALIACALTGGSQSLAVAVLPIVVIAASLRAESRWGAGVAVALGAGFTVAGLLVASGAGIERRVLTGLWWTLYLLATAALVGVFTRRLRRGYELTAESRAEAIAERAALAEERDLRARVLESQQARLDGLRVILHEFRTPVVSMSALARDATRSNGAQPVAPASLALISAHAQHLEDMLDGLADVAITDGSPVGRVRARTVRLADLAAEVFDGAGVDPARRSVSVRPAGSSVICDPQRLRRVLVNLTENAGRVSKPEPVEIAMAREGSDLVVEVRDRGPGLPADQLGVVTSKYTSLGDRKGTTGLGLWIVEQLTTAMGGTLTLAPRPGGGLVARLALPMLWA